MEQFRKNLSNIQ
jgi:hypothetical protein